MSTTDIGIYASLHCRELDDAESAMRAVLGDKGFRRIEQATVLLYEDGAFEASVERHGASFYLSARYQADIVEASSLLEKVAAAFAQRGIAVDIEYQEEDAQGRLAGPCLRIARCPSGKS